MDREYSPNHISTRHRIGYAVVSLALLSYGSYGVWTNSLYVPGRRGGLQLHDAAAWLMYGAIVCACLIMLSVLVDHYDRRNNEETYRGFADFFKLFSLMFYGLALLVASRQGA